MLGLAQSLSPDCQSVFLSFAEGGRCQSFLEQARRQGFAAKALRWDTPHLGAAVNETAHLLRRLRADVLCCHGYKADVLGRLAARPRHVPVIAVARGWTGENAKVRLFEALDRVHLRRMDHVVCVSHSQARKVLRAGVAAKKVSVIHNAIAADRFGEPDPAYRQALESYFAVPPSHIVGAAGRLSPEKGFDVLVDSAALLVARDPSVGFVLFGEGVLRGELSRRIEAAHLSANFVLAGFRDDLDRFVPVLDLLVLPSFTEGLPNVVLEALAAAIPVVATAVGGTPEVIEDGKCGYMVPAGEPRALAARMHQLLVCPEKRRALGHYGRERVARQFTFEIQAHRYQQLFARLSRRAATVSDRGAGETCQGRFGCSGQVQK